MSIYKFTHWTLFNVNFLLRYLVAVPASKALTFASSSERPDVKVIIEVNDHLLVDSRNLTVEVITKENGENNTNSSDKDVEMINYKIVIDENVIEIRSSSENRTVRTSKLMASADLSNQIHWESKDSFRFDCSLTIMYSGKKRHLMSYFKRVRSLATSGDESNNFASLYGDDTFADFTFIVQGRKFSVHKIVLGVVSDVLKTMLLCGLDETKNNSSTVKCDPKIFEHFIKFIYTGQLPVDEMPTICIQLHEIAHRYGVNRLVEICMAFIIEKEIDTSNAIDLYEFSATYKIAYLLEITWKFIKTLVT